MQRHFLVIMVGNVADWLFNVGGALKEVAASEGLTILVRMKSKKINSNDKLT